MTNQEHLLTDHSRDWSPLQQTTLILEVGRQIRSLQKKNRIIVNPASRLFAVLYVLPFWSFVVEWFCSQGFFGRLNHSFTFHFSLIFFRLWVSNKKGGPDGGTGSEIYQKCHRSGRRWPKMRLYTQHRTQDRKRFMVETSNRYRRTVNTYLVKNNLPNMFLFSLSSSLECSKL